MRSWSINLTCTSSNRFRQMALVVASSIRKRLREHHSTNLHNEMRKRKVQNPSRPKIWLKLLSLVYHRNKPFSLLKYNLKFHLMSLLKQNMFAYKCISSFKYRDLYC